MKTLLIILTLSIPGIVFGQGYPMSALERADYYRARGLSFASPPVPRTSYPMSGISTDTQKFKTVFALVLKAYPNLNEEEFLRNLRAGEKYDITKTDPITTCKACNGVGRVPDSKSNEADKKSQCLSCKGLGKSSVRTYFTVCW